MKRPFKLRRVSISFAVRRKEVKERAAAPPPPSVPEPVVPYILPPERQRQGAVNEPRKKPFSWSTRIEDGTITHITIPQRDTESGETLVPVAELARDAQSKNLRSFTIRLRRLMQEESVTMECERDSDGEICAITLHFKKPDPEDRGRFSEAGVGWIF